MLPDPELVNDMPPDTRGTPVLSSERIAQLRKYILEVNDRCIEALNLYEPLPFQRAYHACNAKEVIIQKGNQTGGSLSTFVEVARAVTCQDPYKKYPNAGVAVCLGYGEGHIGRVMYRYLFKWGAFKIIKDRITGEYRTFRPWSATKEFEGKFGDEGREEEAEPAPPLIPKRFIEGKIAFKKRAENIFSLAKFTTGWELHAFNSQGEAEMAQGFQADLFVIDEDLATGGWYVEALGRTAFRKGKIRWNALPHNKTDDMVTMAQRADDQEGQPNPTTVKLKVTMYDNPYMPEESKIHNETAWRQAGEDVYRARALGEFTLDSIRMYPTFAKELHNVIHRLTGVEVAHAAEGRQMRTKVQEVLTTTNGDPPLDWCKYMIFDPGHTIGGVLFYCIPPPSEFGDFKIIYDELYIPRCTAKIWGESIEPKMKDKHFQDFIIDAHGARLTELGSGVLPRRQYELELEKRNIHCEVRGPRFINGSDDVKGREMAVRTWLEIRNSENPLERGYPKLLVNVERCPNFCREMIYFKKKTVRIGGRDVTTDEGNRRSDTHLVECYDADTEVLTKDGWTPFPNLTGNESLATVNIETDAIEYQQSTRLVSREHRGEMIHFSGRKLDALVTPNHRMVVCGQREGDRQFRFREAGDVNASNNVLRLNGKWAGDSPEVMLLPRCVSRQGLEVSQEKELDPYDFAEFLGWFVSEGSAAKTIKVPGNGYRVVISQSRSANPIKYALIGALLDRLPWNYVTFESGYSISSKQLWEFVRPLGTCYEKYVPQWIKDGNTEIIRRFLTSAIMGDGWYRSSGNACGYGTCSKRLADDIQELLIKMGKTASIISSSPESYKAHPLRNKLVRTKNNFHSVYEWSRPYAVLRNSAGVPNFEPVAFEGQVYCATVPNGTLIVRRNGKPIVCGNCGEYAAAHGLAYIKPPMKVAAQLTIVDEILMGRKMRELQRRAKGMGFQSSNINLGPQGSGS